MKFCIYEAHNTFEVDMKEMTITNLTCDADTKVWDIRMNEDNIFSYLNHGEWEVLPKTYTNTYIRVLCDEGAEKELLRDK